MRGLAVGIVVLGALVAGCVQPGAVTCSDGRVCPASSVCDDAHGGCTLRELLEACDGKADRDPCSSPTVTDGICDAGVCVPAGCGNSIVDGDEICDDGNRFHGDGCSADCQSTEVCGNDVIDAVAGEACDDGNTIDGDGCQANCGSPRCGDGVKDVQFNEECDLGAMNSNAPNLTCRTNCQLQRCGDGIVDTSVAGKIEICDDGNRLSNDGCSFDCKSNETCGNGVIDYVTGELCDDGDSLSHDGCGHCQAETLAWTPLSVTAPTARWRHAMAYDAARGRVVMFGGQDMNANILGETWEWNGESWTDVTPATASPTVRRGHAMAYDAKRGVVVMFGGYGTSSTYFDETWEWNGAVWTNVTPLASNPPGREQHGLAYDAARRRIVLFGGYNGSNRFGDTWEWDGAAWTNRTPGAGNPPARRQHALAYDAKRGRVVMFGGNDNIGDSNEIWEWNGTAWANKTPSSGNPAGRSEHVLVYDGAVGRVVLHGDDTREWTGTAWTIASAGPLRYGAAGAYDAGRQRVVTFGGLYGFLNATTHERIDGTWTDVTPPVAAPPARRLHGMAYDGTRGRVIMFGGTDTTLYFDDTYVWFDGAWRLQAPSLAPAGRYGHAMIWDSARARVVLFGGNASGTAQADTWEWNGTTWTDVTPPSGNPPARYHHALAYDSKRGRVVMFGGTDGSINLNDTWEWNGTTWTQPTISSAIPSTRQGHVLTYDGRRSKTVLFGGWQGVVGYENNETWEWSGTAWANVTPTTPGPVGRHWSAITYDAARGRSVLFGGWYTYFAPGQLSPQGIHLDDTWEWDGTRWTSFPLETKPAPRYGPALVYDLVAAQLMLFGGFGSTNYGDVWKLRYGNAGSDESCGTGVDGDSDGLIGCADQDCFGTCSPLCNPSLMTCSATGQRCGDGVCQAIESKRLCPADCGTPTAHCGDFLCDSTETAVGCPGDCTP